MRVTAAFSRLLNLAGVWVRQVRFEPGRVVVDVALKRRRLLCPLCEYSTASRKDKRPVDSVWRHLDLGIWRLEIHCRRRRLWCPWHGARTEGVPFARPGSEFTRDLVSRRVARDAHRQDHDQGDAADRLGHGRADRQARMRRRARSRPSGRPLRHRDRRGQLEAPAQLPHACSRPSARQDRGTDGAGETAADRFFEELDPEIAALPQLDADPEARTASRQPASAPPSSGRSRWTWAMGTPPPPANTLPRR